MRFLIVLVMAILAGTGVTRAQANCNDGDAVTVNGTVASIVKPLDANGTWALLVRGDEGGCIVDAIDLAGPPPEACQPGKRVRASGKFYLSDYQTYVEQVTDLHCE